MLGNRALQAGVTNVTASTVLGYNLSGSTPNTLPPDLLTVSASGTSTITLPQIAVPQYGGLGIGDSQQIRVLNLHATGVVVLACDSDDTILGKYAGGASIAPNGCAVCISKVTSSSSAGDAATADGIWYTF